MTDPHADSVPVIRLDPFGADHYGEAQRLRDAGPVVRVVLPGEVAAWAVTEHQLIVELVRHPHVSKDWRNWAAFRRGDVALGSPVVGMIYQDNMLTKDGSEHVRLRRPVAAAFTRGAIAEMRIVIAEVVADLLDSLPSHADQAGVVDLRQEFAHALPMRVIADLIGVPLDLRPRLQELADRQVRTDNDRAQVERDIDDRKRLFADLVTLRRRSPCGDLASRLALLIDSGDLGLDEEEVADTLWLLASAGHETTKSLIVNAVRALLTHPEQLAAARRGGSPTWSAVVEETLRWAAPVGNFPARFPVEDVTLAGVTIPAGDAVIAPYSCPGRDPRQHGPNAGSFDVSRMQISRHLAFGEGAHVCPGAHLARLEASLALEAFFTRFPQVRLAIDPSQLEPVASVFVNTTAALPVQLGGPAAA
jgi:2-hydroxy-5-methyl-1-naphthoate 7-hydroxylase